MVETSKCKCGDTLYKYIKRCFDCAKNQTHCNVKHCYNNKNGEGILCKHHDFKISKVNCLVTDLDHFYSGYHK